MMQAEHVSLFILLIIATLFIGLALLPVEIVVEDEMTEEEVLTE